MTEPMNLSFLDVTQDAQNRARATLQAASHMQAMCAIEAIVIHGADPKLVARKCGFNVTAPAAGSTLDLALDPWLALVGGTPTPKPTGMQAFTSWLQAELARTIERATA